MSAKTPENVIIRAIHEALVKYPEGDGGPHLDCEWVQPEQKFARRKGHTFGIGCERFRNCQQGRVMHTVVNSTGEPCGGRDRPTPLQSTKSGASAPSFYGVLAQREQGRLLLSTREGLLKRVKFTAQCCHLVG